MEKPKLESKYVVDELTVVCNSIGKLDENDGTYMKDRDCKPCLREMLRFLNADSNEHPARSTLGALNVIKSDLIPIIVQYCDYVDGDPDLFTIVLRLCVNLTAPVAILFEKQDDPSSPEQQKISRKLSEYLRGYKEAFALDERIWSTLNVHLKSNTDDEITFERLIILIRNVLQISDEPTTELGTREFDIHEMCLHNMDRSGMLNTIIYIASESQRGTEFCFHIMEIIYYMLKNQSPVNLASARQDYFKRKLDDSDPDKRRLAELTARDKRQRQANRVMNVPRFKNSAFSINNCRSLSDAPLIIRQPISSRVDLRFDSRKQPLRKPKNKKPLSSETSMILSDQNTKASKVTYSLKMFCQQFVEKVYNNYMQHIKHNLIQKKAQEDDESYYLWSLQFFTCFNRNSSKNLDYTSETLSTSTLHYIQVLITSYVDKLEIEKKQFETVSRRLQLAVRAYREILYLIKSIEPESQFHQVVESIQRNIFTELEYSSLMLNLFQHYSEPKHSKHYLRDLIQTNHCFLELLEKYSKNHASVEIENDKEMEDNEELGNKTLKSRKRKKAELRATHFVSRYCCPDVIRLHLEALKNFKFNEDETNLAILKLFERIAYDCRNEVILFQASVFKCLLEIRSYDPSMAHRDGFIALAQHLMQCFGVSANKKRWMFQELLFWKTANDVIEIENAIDPPAAPATDREVGSPVEVDDPVQDELENAPPGDSIADLLAELRDSDDEPIENEYGSKSCAVDDLLEELRDDSNESKPTQNSLRDSCSSVNSDNSILCIETNLVNSDCLPENSRVTSCDISECSDEPNPHQTGETFHSPLIDIPATDKSSEA